MRKLSVFLLAVLMCLCWFINASAVESPMDLNTKGSLSVTMKCSHGYTSGGNVALYRIASLTWTGTNYKFEYTEDFKDCPLSLDEVWGELSAKAYHDYIVENRIVVDRNILHEGTTVFGDIPLGLYLVVHEEPTDGFSAALPFLVTVPVSSGDGWEYNVDATPKVEIKHSEVLPPPDIPQTGQLKWPIPVMLASGIIVFAIGLVLCFKRSRE